MARMKDVKIQTFYSDGMMRNLCQSFPDIVKKMQKFLNDTDGIFLGHTISVENGEGCMGTIAYVPDKPKVSGTDDEKAPSYSQE